MASPWFNLILKYHGVIKESNSGTAIALQLAGEL
jgi:hypothetical protein